MDGDEKQGTSCISFICRVSTVWILSVCMCVFSWFHPIQPMEKIHLWDNRCSVSFSIFHVTGEKKKCAPLFYFINIFFNQVLDLFDTGMNTPIISQSVHPSE